LVELWFALLCFMLTLFVVLDGWDIGAGSAALSGGEERPGAATGDRGHRSALELA